MLVLVKKLIFDLHLDEEIGGIEVRQAALLFMLARLQEIDAVTGTIERDLALLAAALRTDAAVDGRAEALSPYVFRKSHSSRDGSPESL